MVKFSYPLATATLLAFCLSNCGGNKTSTVTPITPTSSESSINASSSSSANISSSSSSGSMQMDSNLINNGGFEDSEVGTASPPNWTVNTGNNLAEAQVVEANNENNSHTGSKALQININTLGEFAWDIELSYNNIAVTGGRRYDYSFWVKGTSGAQVHFTVGTPAPDYNERARQEMTLSGEWQEVSMTVLADASDTLLRVATHFSNAGNTGAVIHVDDLSFEAAQVLSDYSEVTVRNLYALSPNNMPIGVAVPAGNATNSILNSPVRQAIIEQHFSQLSAENIMKMDALHPAENTYNFTQADALKSYADAHNLSIHGHVLVWHSQIPGWMQNFSGSKTNWINMMESHVRRVAEHFEEVGDGDTVMSWDVVNEAFMEDGGYRGEFSGESVWYANIGAEFIERAFITAREADPDAELYYNDYNLIWSNDKLDAVINMVNDFQSRDIPIDGVGFQSHISLNSPQISTIRSQFQKIVDIRPKIKLKITELDVRVNNIENPVSELTPQTAENHKQYIYEIINAYLEIVPADQRGGISVWGISDADSWILHLYNDRDDWPLFFFDNFEPKPALQGFADALQNLQ